MRKNHSQLPSDKAAYPGCIHAVVDAPKFSTHRFYHFLHARGICDVDSKGDCAVICVDCKTLTFVGYMFGFLLVDVCESDRRGPCLSKCIGSLLAYCARSLKYVRSITRY